MAATVAEWHRAQIQLKTLGSPPLAPLVRLVVAPLAGVGSVSFLCWSVSVRKLLIHLQLGPVTKKRMWVSSYFGPGSRPTGSHPCLFYLFASAFLGLKRLKSLKPSNSKRPSRRKCLSEPLASRRHGPVLAPPQIPGCNRRGLLLAEALSYLSISK